MADSSAHVFELAPELALGIVGGDQRARALEHLASCPECRRAVDELSGVADELLLLAPPREAPLGFESRVLDSIRPPRRRRRGLRFLAPVAAAAAAVAVTVAVVRDDLRLASDYRGTLAEADGEAFDATPIEAPGGARAGTLFYYQGSPSWVLAIVDRGHRGRVGGAEIVTDDGGRIALPGFRLDPGTGSFGRALPVALGDVAVFRLLEGRGGRALVARPND